MNKVKHSSPWLWVPTLYFAEGVPYFLVNNISVMLFAKMGVPNDQLAFFTTLLYFPWFLKGLWSPLVDVVKTKRWWIVAMQLLMAVLCVLLTLSLPHPDASMMAAKGTPVSMFWLTLVLFIITAFASATHDIAADGYYMIAHDSCSQARFIGIRSTFYRIAMVFGQGVLVFIAGRFEKSTGDIPLSWQLTLGITAVILFAVTIYHIFALPRVERAIGKESGRSPKVESQKSKDACDDKGQELSIGEAFKTFFTKKGVVLAICFMLLYRMAEGLLVKLSLPFLVDSREVIEREGQLIGGGLGLDADVGGIGYESVPIKGGNDGKLPCLSLSQIPVIDGQAIRIDPFKKFSVISLCMIITRAPAELLFCKGSFKARVTLFCEGLHCRKIVWYFDWHICSPLN